jgi:tRNA(fMet)-specific endonuclease VapC
LTCNVRSGAKQAWLHANSCAHAGDRFFLPAIALGEFAAGFADERDQTFVETVHHFAILTVDGGTALVYRMLFRDLKSAGQLIGTNDLWIAATAIHHNLPLLTSNKAEFLRIRPLRIINY